MTPDRLKKLPLFLLLVVLVFCQCKKGEEDPALSLKSRKSRLEGEWRMGAGYASFTYNYTGAKYNESWNFDGTSFTLNTTEAGPPVIYVGKYFLNLNIRKDGTFDFNEFFVGKMLDCSGTWCFTEGKGEEKKKESVLFTITATRQGDTYAGLFNRTGATFRYRLIGLGKETMKMHSVGKLGLDEDGQSLSCVTDFDFTTHED